MELKRRDKIFLPVQITIPKHSTQPRIENSLENLRSLRSINITSFVLNLRLKKKKRKSTLPPRIISLARENCKKRMDRKLDSRMNHDRTLEEKEIAKWWRGEVASLSRVYRATGASRVYLCREGFDSVCSLVAWIHGVTRIP